MALRWRVIQEHESCSPSVILQCDDGGSWEDVPVVDDDGCSVDLCVEVAVKKLRRMSREQDENTSSV